MAILPVFLLVKSSLVFSITHPWLSMYIQGLLRNEIVFLIPNHCHCGETNNSGYNPNILVSTRNDELLMLIDLRAMDAERNIVTGLISIYIINRY